MNQIAWSWDEETIRKTLKGCMYAAIVGALFGAGDYLVEHREVMDITHAFLEGFAVAAISAGLNAVKEFLSGVFSNEEIQ